MANHQASFNGAPPPDAFITSTPIPPRQPPSFTITVTSSFLSTAQAPTVVISIRHHWKYFFMRPRPEGNHVEEHAFSAPPKRFPVPIFLLLTRSLWHQMASGMLSHFAFGSEAHTLLFSHLCNLGAGWAEDAIRHGSTRLDVALDVHERSELEYFPPPFPTLTDPRVNIAIRKGLCRPEDEVEGAERDSSLRDVRGLFGRIRKIDEGGDRDSLLSSLPHRLPPWSSRATTCPLCRSSLQRS